MVPCKFIYMYLINVHQGNSNSLSTIDVSVGFIGLEDYQLIFGSLLVLLSTYSGPIFWIIALLQIVAECSETNCESNLHDEFSKSVEKKTKGQEAMPLDHQNYLETTVRKKFSRDILEVCFVLVLTRTLPLAVYTVMVCAQRYHLFVWTVFSPKLLYEGLHTMVVSTVVLMLLLVRSLLLRWF